MDVLEGKVAVVTGAASGIGCALSAAWAAEGMRVVMADIEAAAAYVGGKKLGIVGYCFGGTVAWWGATRTTKFAGASCWYGGGIAGTKDEHPHCPVQMHFGEKDASIPMSDVEMIKQKRGGDCEIYVYAGADHGFNCEERGSYNEAAAKLARERSVAFLNKHLKR